MGDDAVLRVTEPAREMVLQIRAGEEDPESLALFLEVNGVSNGAYTYDMWFQQASDAAGDDAVVDAGGLLVVVAASSVAQLEGATLDVGTSGGEQGLVMLNPNTPKPTYAGSELPGTDLSHPVAQRILEILEQDVNPQIGMHGGYAELVAYHEGTAYVAMLGGCQGCGLASVTLSQGISVALKEAVPEVEEIVDVTDHAAGTNPYYQASKK